MLWDFILQVDQPYSFEVINRVVSVEVSVGGSHREITQIYETSASPKIL